MIVVKNKTVGPRPCVAICIFHRVNLPMAHNLPSLVRPDYDELPLKTKLSHSRILRNLMYTLCRHLQA